MVPEIDPSIESCPMNLEELVKGRIWSIPYPIHYFGNRCNSRCTLVRLEDDTLFVHSPSPLTPETRQAVASLGEVSAIVAPGNFHHFHAAEWAENFPRATLWICPHLARKRPALAKYEKIEDDRSYPWCGELSHLSTRGHWFINEVAFFHRPTRSLILTDLIENFTDASAANWVLKFWMKLVFRMWNNPKSAPEYQLGWRNKSLAREMLEKVLQWDFERIILTHGEVITEDARATARRAWRSVLT